MERVAVCPKAPCSTPCPAAGSRSAPLRRGPGLVLAAPPPPPAGSAAPGHSGGFFPSTGHLLLKGAGELKGPHLHENRGAEWWGGALCKPVE